MKKEWLAMSALVSIVIFVSIISASIQLSCSDNSKLISEQNEIAIGNYRLINELGIGVTKASESIFYKKISADLLVDTKRTILSNKSSENLSSETISLLSGNYAITLTKTNSTSATIEVDGSSTSISLLDTKEVKGIFVMLAEIISEEDGSVVKLIAGSKKISLSNDQNPAEKIIIGNKTYVVELSSASSTNALIKVSKCASGEINIDIINEAEQKSNQTANQTKTKQTEEERVKEENERLNASTKQIIVAEFNARKKLNISGNETLEKSKEMQGFFSRIWNWIKRLFNFKIKANPVMSNNSSQQILNILFSIFTYG